MENRNRFGLDKMNDELVNDILPFEFNLPKNQKNLLATLIYINGIDKKDKDGFFYVDNKYLMEVLGVSEPTIISNANKLIEEGFIQRVTGKKNHPSKYLVTDLIKEYTKEYTKDFSKYTKEYTKDFSKYTKEYTKKYTKNFSKNFSKTVENFSQDKDIDKEKDKEYIFNIINNIIKENNINLINNINYIIKKEIENIKEKENLSSINEKKEIETMRELNEQVNSLQEEKAKLTSRLDNCAKQFKQMMQTIKELQLENKKMMQRIDELEAKQNNTSTTSSIDSSSIQEKSDSKPSNDSALTTIHQEEEKPTVAQQMPSMTIVDKNATPKEEEKQTEGKKNDSTVDVNEVMKDFANAVKQYEEEKKEHCNEDVLNKFKTLAFQYLDEKKVDNSKRKKVEERINNFINYYKGKNNSKPSNDSTFPTTHQEDKQPSTVEEERKDCAEKKEDATEPISSSTTSDNDSALTTTHQDEEKSTVAQQMPLNGKELRYIDRKTDKKYSTEAEAQQDGVNPWYLYDTKIGRCLTSYTSPLSPSNDPSGITTQPNEEKPTVAQQMPSMTIVEDDATPKEEEKAKKHMYFKEVTTLTDEILNELKKNYSTSDCLKLFKIDLVNHTIVSKTSKDILGYGEESKEVRYRIAMDSKEGKKLMKMVGVGVGV